MRTKNLPDKNPLQLTFNALKTARTNRNHSKNNKRRYWSMWRK